MNTDRIDLSVVPRTSEGLVVRSELLAAGMPSAAIDRALRSRELRRVQRGVYVPSGFPITPRVIAAAVLRSAGEPIATISHQTAARLHALPLANEPTTEHVTIPFCARKPHRGLLTVHCHDLDPVDVQIVGGIRTTCPIRTAFDLLFGTDQLTAIWACEAAVRNGLFPLSELQYRVNGVWNAPYARQARRLVSSIEPRSESPLETAARLVLVTGKLPAPRVQEPIINDAGRVIYRLDLAYPEWLLGIELDGRRTHDTPEAVFTDRRRQNYLTAHGWTILRFTWFDVARRPAYVVSTVRDALDQLKRVG